MAIDPNNLAGTATLTFSEDFNNLSLWNGSTGRWSTTYNFNGYDASTLSGNGEQEWYINANDPNQASVKPWSVSNGVLTIAANHATSAIKPYIDNYDYTSGLLTTQNSFSQTYGYFEIDAKLPAGQGMWPAFWMMPTNGDWRPELDVMEVLGSDTNSLWQFSHPSDQSYDRPFNTTVPDMSAGFHRYGVDWEPDKITFYFDGQVTGVAPTAPDMNGPMYMLLNLAVGGSWGGAPDSTTHFPADLQVDYIRAYESKTDTGGSDTTGGSGSDTTGGAGSGGEVFNLAPGTPETISGFSATDHDMLAVAAGAGGFQLSGYTGQAAVTVVDAADSWANIADAQVIRWLGAASDMNSAAKVDAVLQAMPGNEYGGALVVGYTSAGQVGIYYDSDPAHAGGASLVATLSGVTKVSAVTATSFEFGSAGAGSDTGSGDTGTGTDSGTGSGTGTGTDTGTGGSGSGGDTLAGSSTLTGTANDDTFMLSTAASERITNYDAAGHDQIGVPVGSGGFALTGSTSQATPVLVDASAWWNGIDGAQVVRWTGDPTVMNSAAKVDGVLQSMPGNQGHGVFVIGYDASGEVALYYDGDPAGAGGAKMVAAIVGMTDTTSLTAGDFHLFS